MKINSEFKAYNDIPWFTKEAIGWPDNFMKLSTEQQNFVRDLCFQIISSSSIRDDLQNLKTDLEEIIGNLN